MDVLHQFYCSKAWRELAFALKVAADGRCARCGEIVIDFAYLIGHHKEELTEENVRDPAVALNPDNVEVICLDCHNKEHRRFGGQHKVYIVWGSPMSGKSTLVRQMMRHGDIVIDMDRLWSAVTMQPLYVKPDNVRFNIFALRDSLVDQIRTRYGQWYDAYVIGGYPDPYERERLAQYIGAQCIYCECIKEDCYKRLEAGGKPKAWKKYIDEWWRRFERRPPGAP